VVVVVIVSVLLSAGFEPPPIRGLFPPVLLVGCGSGRTATTPMAIASGTELFGLRGLQGRRGTESDTAATDVVRDDGDGDRDGDGIARRDNSNDNNNNNDDRSFCCCAFFGFSLLCRSLSPVLGMNESINQSINQSIPINQS